LHCWEGEDKDEVDPVPPCGIKYEWNVSVVSSRPRQWYSTKIGGATPV
jgi:hypothetical protein